MLCRIKKKQSFIAEIVNVQLLVVFLFCLRKRKASFEFRKKKKNAHLSQCNNQSVDINYKKKKIFLKNTYTKMFNRRETKKQSNSH